MVDPDSRSSPVDGFPRGAASRLAIVGGALLAAGIFAFLWEGLPQRAEWGITASVLGAGFLSLALHLCRAVHSWRLTEFSLVTGERRAALSATGEKLPPELARGENFAVELKLVPLRNVSLENAACTLQLSERSDIRQGEEYLYRKLYEAVSESPLTDPAPRKGAIVRFAFLSKIPEDRPVSDERRRWEIHVAVKARGIPDFAAAAPIRVV